MTLLLTCVLVSGLLTFVGFVVEDYLLIRIGIGVMGILTGLSLLL